MHKLACFGDNCVDYYDQSRKSYYGGNPVNVAVYTKRLGHYSSYIGAVGKDTFGEGMICALAAKGVDVSHVHREEGKTALTHVSIVDGDRVFGDYEEGVMADFLLTESDMVFIADHDLGVTGLWGRCEEQLPLLKEKGLTLAFDSSDRPEDPVAVKVYPFVDIFFFSDDTSDEENLKKKMASLYRKGPRIVVATRGEKGSLAFDGNRYFSQGIVEVKVADTMGAGDSFIAGFLNAYVEGKTISECMTAGALCSAETLRYHGAW